MITSEGKEQGVRLVNKAREIDNADRKDTFVWRDDIWLPDIYSYEEECQD